MQMFHKINLHKHWKDEYAKSRNIFLLSTTEALFFFPKKQLLEMGRIRKCIVYIMINIHTTQTSTVQWPDKNVLAQH